MIRQTHTYATLAVSDSTYDEIKRLLTEAKYDHAFITQGDGIDVIDMHGIGLVRNGEPHPKDNPHHPSNIDPDYE